MWLTLIVMVLSYLMQPRDTKEERKKALVNSAVLGAGTYAVTEYTDWGQENLKPLDDSIGNFFSPTEKGAKVAGSSEQASGVLGQTAAGAAVKTSTNGWDVMKEWGPTEILATGAVAGAATGGIKPWMLGAAAVGLVLVAK